MEKLAADGTFGLPDMGPYLTEYNHQYNLRSHARGIDLMAESTEYEGPMSRMVPVKRYTYRDDAKGVVPGYKGHIPGTKDIKRSVLLATQLQWWSTSKRR